MAYELRVNTGMVRVPVIDEDGEELGSIRFNPTDTDIIKRYKDVAKYFKEMGESWDEKSSDPDSLIATSESIKEKIDYLFNSNVSETLFVKCAPLTPMEDGNIFLFVVMDAIESLISQVFDDRVAKMKKVEEATKEYN